MTDQYVPFVFIKKTVALQRLGDAVRGGYRWYVTGSLPQSKISTFCEKQSARYDLSWSPVRTRAARKSGKAVFRLILLRQDREPDVIHWWLLRTEGEMSSEAGREKWRNAHRDRIFFQGYELVRTTKSGADHAVWTWRMPPDAERELRERVILLIRQKRDRELQELIDGVWRAPGFSGVRDQVKKVRTLLVREWKRSRAEGEAMPAVPERIGYLRRLPSLGQPLTEILGGKVRQRAVRKSKVE
ncbi:MAG: hypothetical protein GJU77_04450 [Ferrovum sp.]|jgi:hypothetical protein|uniref:hypothetical protein n=1 Tax=Ferrovum sp. TaxID=2609467 RepID=UPI002636ED6E|nr:hypothetical protein [Ferrovum sp.]MBW8066249.1 hypothetical protein [Ferrovum sp.]MBW8072922.1 hypothetical protein [Ferrovum sp.]